MGNCFPERSWPLVAGAMILTAALTKDQTPEQIARMATFFTVLGDTMALIALDPCLEENEQLNQ